MKYFNIILFLFINNVYSQNTFNYSFDYSKLYASHNFSISKIIYKGELNTGLLIAQNLREPELGDYKLAGKFWANSAKYRFGFSCNYGKIFYHKEDKYSFKILGGIDIRYMPKWYYIVYYNDQDSSYAPSGLTTKPFVLPQLYTGIGVSVKLTDKLFFVQKFTMGYVKFITKEKFEFTHRQIVTETDIKSGSINWSISTGIGYSF